MREFETEFDFYLNEGVADEKYRRIRNRNKLFVESIQSTSSYWDWINSINQGK